VDVNRLGEVSKGLGGPGRAQDDMAFLTDGSTVRSWSIAPERLVGPARSGRDWTRAEWVEVLPDRPYRPMFTAGHERRRRPTLWC